MGKQYEHLSLDERCRIARLHEDGQSIRQIAAALDRPPSTVSRELRRNRGKQVGDRPSHAHEQAKARRWTGSRLERDGKLRRLVLDRQKHGWSPEQIAGRLACDKAATGVSHESIYRFIYAQIRRTNDGSWRHELPRAKAKRGWRGRKGGSSASSIRSVSPSPSAPRPPTAGPSQDIGKPTSCSSKPMARPSWSPTSASPVSSSSPDSQTKLPNPPRDNSSPGSSPCLPNCAKPSLSTEGTEFAEHYRLKADLGIQTFFCDTHSPWQKGGIENAIGRMRLPSPRKTDLAAVRPKILNAVVAAYNNTPRKCLDIPNPSRGIPGSTVALQM